MDQFFIFIVLALAFIAIYAINTIESKSYNTRKRCNEWGVRHEWVKKGVGDDTYLVCEKCKVLLSGLKEEGDGGRDDF